MSITLAGAIAKSFDVHSGLTVNVSGVGSSSAANWARPFMAAYDWL
jgi:hypothetical protein